MEIQDKTRERELLVIAVVLAQAENPNRSSMEGWTYADDLPDFWPASPPFDPRLETARAALVEFDAANPDIAIGVQDAAEESDAEKLDALFGRVRIDVTT